MVFSLVFAFIITYVIQGPVFYTHFFYIPIVLACIWWKRKGIFVAIFLAVLYFLTFSYVKKNLGDEYVIGRAIMFLAIAYLVIKVRER